MLEEVMISLASAVVGSALTSLAAFAAFRVEIRWLVKEVNRVDESGREERRRIERSTERAHERIDGVETRLGPIITSPAMMDSVIRGGSSSP